MKRLAATIAIGAAATALPGAAGASHEGPGGANQDFAVGGADNQFLIAIGNAHLSLAAHSDPDGTDSTGHVRARGEPDGEGPFEPFELEGAVTCLRVEGNRAAIKYVFKHAEGSAAPFEGGGAQIFVEDNGEPKGGDAVDATTFDPPQPAGVFQLDMNRCDDPSLRLYDQVESGDFTVHDAAP
jgi:hypothetical protein